MCNAGVARAVCIGVRTSELAWRAAATGGRGGVHGRTIFSSIMERDVALGDLLMHPDPIMHDAVCTSKRSAVAREERRIGNLPPRTVARRSAWPRRRECGGKPETCTNATNGRGGGLGVGAKRGRACRGRGGARHARDVPVACTPFVRLLRPRRRERARRRSAQGREAVSQHLCGT